VAEEQWREAQHELKRQVSAIVALGRLTAEQAGLLREVVRDLAETGVNEVTPSTPMSTSKRSLAGGSP
jgi:hypothetical protein